jgi:regulator of RNase E activity RraA
VAAIYQGLADVLVLDEQDAELAARVEQLGMRAVVVDTIMRDSAARERLARAALDAAGIAA